MPQGFYIRSEQQKEFLRTIGKAQALKNIGKKQSIETIQKRVSKLMAENNPAWKGNNARYGALHKWIKKRLSKPKFCQNCKEKPPRDLANISGKYKRELSDWKWICRRCHMLEDGRLAKFIKGVKS